MKHFGKAFGLGCLFVIASTSMAGTLYVWDGGASASANWTQGGPGGNNWVTSSYPGNTDGDDLAQIADPTGPSGATAIFAGNDATTGSYSIGTRFVHHIELDAVNGAMTLQITGGTLSTRQFDIKAGDADNRNATLDLDGGTFDVEWMNVTATTSVRKVLFDLEVDFSVSGTTVMQGNIDVDILAGMTFDTGQLIIKGQTDDTVVKMIGAGLFQSS